MARAWSTVAAALTDSHPRSASMSSMFMRTIISSSTTRTRRPESRLSMKGGSRRGNVDRADHAVRPVVEVGSAVQFEGQTVFDHPRAEPLSRRRRHGRAALLAPRQDQPAALRPRFDIPRDPDASGVAEKRAVLHGVGGEFVKRYSQGQGGF